MINNRQTGRRRGRNGPRPQGMDRPHGGGGGGNRPETRGRGNAPQLHEKYKAMARDAQLAGDRVQTEYYLQFADHYYRILNENRPRFEERPQRDQSAVDGDSYNANDDFDEDGEDGSDEEGQSNGYDEPVRSQSQSQARGQEDRPRQNGSQQNGSYQQPRGDRDDRPQQQDRQQQDRPQQDRPQHDRSQQRPRDERPQQRYERDDRPARDERPSRDDRPQAARADREERPGRNRNDRNANEGAGGQQPGDQQPGDQQPEMSHAPVDAAPSHEERPTRTRAPRAATEGTERAPRTRTPRAATAAPANDGPVEPAGIDLDRLPPAIARSEAPVDAVSESAEEERPRPVRRVRRPREDAPEA